MGHFLSYIERAFLWEIGLTCQLFPSMLTAKDTQRERCSETSWVKPACWTREDPISTWSLSKKWAPGSSLFNGPDILGGQCMRRQNSGDPLCLFSPAKNCHSESSHLHCLYCVTTVKLPPPQAMGTTPVSQPPPCRPNTTALSLGHPHPLFCRTISMNISDIGWTLSSPSRSLPRHSIL